MVHQTAMYYEDRLSGAGFNRVVLAGGGSPGADGAQDAEYLRRALEQRLDARVDTIDPRSAATLTDRITANAELLDDAGAARRHSRAGTGGLNAMLRTNLSTRPFYNERGVHGLARPPRRSSWRSLRFSISRRSCC